MAKVLELQLKKLWLKMLKAYAKGKMNKGKKLEYKIIALEAELGQDRV